MKDREFTTGITFFVSLNVYKKLKDLSHLKRVSSSEVIREALNFYFASQNGSEGQMKSVQNVLETKEEKDQ